MGCDESISDNTFRLRHPNEVDPRSQVTYVLSDGPIHADNKAGMSNVKDCGLQRVTRQIQIPDGSRVQEFYAIASTVKEMEDLFDDNSEFKSAVLQIWNVCPYYQGRDVDRQLRQLLNAIAEACIFSSIKSDPKMVLENCVQGPGTFIQNILNQPPRTLNEVPISMFSGTQDAICLLTWTTLITFIRERMKSETCDQETSDMLNAVLKPEREGGFLQNATLQIDLFNNTSILLPYRNACDEPGIMPKLMPVIDELKELLRNSCPNDEKVSSLRVILDKLNTNNMGTGVNFIRPDAKLFASSTAKKLANLEKDIRSSGKKTLLVVEEEHFMTLKSHDPNTFERYFGRDPDAQVIRSDGKRAADVYGLDSTSESSIIVMKSLWRIFAPDTHCDIFYKVGAKERAEKSGDLLAIQTVLQQSGIPGLDSDAQNKAGGSVNDAIHNNTLHGYHTGLELQSGVSGVANILAGKGYEIDPCLVPALILLLGASDFANVMDILGSPIDKQNFEASLGSIQRNQGDLGRMSQQTRDKMSAGSTGKVVSQQARDRMSESYKRNFQAKRYKERAEGKLIQVYSTKRLCGHSFEVYKDKYAPGNRFTCTECGQTNQFGQCLTIDKYNEWLQLPWYQCRSCQGFRRCTGSQKMLRCRNKECENGQGLETLPRSPM